jgi:hypothetical protein
MTTLAYYQNNKDGFSLEIRNVFRKDDLAKKSPDGKTRLTPISFQFVFNGTEAGAFTNLEAVLETVNTDGARSRVVKGIQDGTSNTLREDRIDLQTPEGVFAREFTLTIRGKWRAGDASKTTDVNAVRKGSFPAPANLVERKK